LRAQARSTPSASTSRMLRASSSAARQDACCAPSLSLCGCVFEHQRDHVRVPVCGPPRAVPLCLESRAYRPQALAFGAQLNDSATCSLLALVLDKRAILRSPTQGGGPPMYPPAAPFRARPALMRRAITDRSLGGDSSEQTTPRERQFHLARSLPSVSSLVSPALVAQGIEHRFPKPRVSLTPRGWWRPSTNLDLRRHVVFMMAAADRDMH
jgi:hypothetical protein